MALENIRIDQIIFGDRARKDYGDVAGLSESIKQKKLLQPIVVMRQGKYFRLLAGGRRIKACQMLHWVKIPAIICEDKDDLYCLEVERDENGQRKQLAPSEMVALGQAIEERLGERRGQPPKVLAANAANTSKGKTSDIVAEAVGFSSGDTYERAKEVVANGEPELVKAMDNGEVSISAAAKKVREPAPSDADETLKDGEGHIVPSQSAPAFNSLATFAEIDGLLRQVQKKIDEIARGPGGEQLKPCLRATGNDEKVIYKSEHLNELKRELRSIRPHSICPYCAGKCKKDCKGCTGRGWVSKYTWDNTADDVKARIA